MIYIDLQHDFPDTAVLEHAASLTLEMEASAEEQSGDITIVLTDDAELHRLNQEFLGIDAPTDVLSFPAEEEDPDTGVPYLGDILISVPRAALQAKTAGHSLEAEAQLLVVHGALHLLGHDHADPEEKARMWKAQAGLLSKLGLGHIKVPDSE